MLSSTRGAVPPDTSRTASKSFAASKASSSICGSSPASLSLPPMNLRYNFNAALNFAAARSCSAFQTDESTSCPACAAAQRVLMADPKAEFLPRFLEYVREKYPDYRREPMLKRLGKKKLILLTLLEGKHYGLARTMFRLAGKLKKN